jgi:hypothetical protein
MKRAHSRLASSLLMLILIAACSPAASTPEATIMPTLVTTPGNMEDEPTPLAFDVSETADVTATQEATAESTASSTAESNAPISLETDSINPGEFRVQITGGPNAVFESSHAMANVQQLRGDNGWEMVFYLGEDNSTDPAQQVTLSLPSNVTAGTYEIGGLFAAAVGQGQLGVSSDDRGSLDTGDPDVTAVVEGMITITEVDADSISGSFEFTADGTITARGVFNQIPPSN